MAREDTLDSRLTAFTAEGMTPIAWMTQTQEQSQMAPMAPQTCPQMDADSASMSTGYVRPANGREAAGQWCKSGAGMSDLCSGLIPASLFHH
jgi:hypothetical protein